MIPLALLALIGLIAFASGDSKPKSKTLTVPGPGGSRKFTPADAKQIMLELQQSSAVPVAGDPAVRRIQRVVGYVPPTESALAWPATLPPGFAVLVSDYWFDSPTVDRFMRVVDPAKAKVPGYAVLAENLAEYASIAASGVASVPPGSVVPVLTPPTIPLGLSGGAPDASNPFGLPDTKTPMNPFDPTGVPGDPFAGYWPTGLGTPGGMPGTDLSTPIDWTKWMDGSLPGYTPPTFMGR